MAEIQNIPMNEKLRYSNPKINQNFYNLNKDVGEVDKKITDHIVSTTAHRAEDITYTGQVPAADIKAAIDNVNGRISEIVAQAGDDNTEIVDARGGYLVMGDRLNAFDEGLAVILRVFNVKSFGAVGDGITDDTAAISAAVDNAHAEGGGDVFFPIGNYRVSATIILKKNVRLIGSGRSRTGYATQTASASVISPLSDYGDVIRIEKGANGSGIERVSIQYPGVGFYSTSTPSTHVAISFTPAGPGEESSIYITEGVVIREVDIIGMKVGILMPWQEGLLDWANYMFCVFEQVNLLKCGAGLILNAQSGNRFVDVHVDRAFGVNPSTIQPKCCIPVGGSVPSPTYNKICSNWVNDLGSCLFQKFVTDGCTGDAFVLQDSIGTTICEGNTNSSTGAGIVLAGAGSQTRVVNFQSSLNEYGIRLTTTNFNIRGVDLVNCKFESNQKHGVYFNPAAPSTNNPVPFIQNINITSCYIQNNSILTSNSYDGIHSESSNNVKVIGGFIGGDAAVNSQRYAVYAFNMGSSQWTIANTTISGNMTTDIPAFLGDKCFVTNCIGVNNVGFSFAGKNLPTGTGSGNKVLYDFPFPSRVYLNGGSGVHIVGPDGTDFLLPSGTTQVTLNYHDSIYFETLPTSWRFYGL